MPDGINRIDCGRVAGGRISVVPEAASEVLDIFGATMIVRSDGSTNGMFVGEHIVPPGYVVPPHVHDLDDEAFFLLQGELTLIGADGESIVGPGSFVDLPHGVAHGFRNDTEAAIRLVVTCRRGFRRRRCFATSIVPDVRRQAG